MPSISGFQASDIGQYGIGDLTWWNDFSPFGFDWNVPVPVGALYDIFRPWIDPPARIGVPQIPVFTGPAITGDFVGPVIGVAEVPLSSPADVIDPDFRKTETVFEDAPGGIYETNRAETDWDAYYDRFRELNEPEGAEVAIDWGELIGGVIGGIWDPFGAGAAVQTAFNPPGVVAGLGGPGTVPTGITGVTGGAAVAGCGPTGPKYAKVCIATGVVTPLRRRRRRRLLTSSDIKDLSALKSIVGGAALQGAVVQAVRR